MPPALRWRRPSWRKLDKFFEAVGDSCDFRKGREFRVREADFVPDTITARLMALQGRIVEVVKRTEDEFLKAELQELGRRIRDARVGYRNFSRTKRRAARLLGRADRERPRNFSR